MSNDLVPFQAPPPAVLVDVNGKPLRQAVQTLTREVSAPTMAGVRSIMSGHPAQGLDPVRLANILRAAENGDATAYLELAEEMEEKYPHYQAVLGTRKRAVTRLPINVEAAGDSEEEEGDAQLVRDWLKRPTLKGELFDILDALGKGYSGTEIVWELTAKAWLPAKLCWRFPQFFEFDQVCGDQLLLRGGIDGTMGLPQPLPEHKFVVHYAQAKSGLPIRGGLARTVAWYYLFINFTIKDWMTFLEVYGLPLRVGKYANGTSEDDIRKLAQAVAQVGSDAGCVIPQSMVLEFIQSGGAAANPDMFHAFLTFANDEVSKAVLGQTSSADAKSGGLGTGQASLHGDVRDDIRDADANQASVTLTRDLARSIVMFNRGARERYPLIRIGEPDAIDMDRELKAIEAAVKYKVPVGQTYFRKVTGVPAPEPDEELLQDDPETPGAGAGENDDGPSGAKAAAPAFSGPSQGQNGAIQRRGKDAVAAAARIDAGKPPREPDAVDNLVDGMVGQLAGLDDALLGGFEDMIAAANSMDEVRELMAIRAGDMIAAMDVTAVAQLLERAGFASRVAGLIEKPGR